MTEEYAAGVVVSLDDELFFVPAGVAERIVQRPVVTRVPGTRIGMALIGGHVVTVINVSPRRGELLLCNLGSEPLALSGLSIQGSGFYATEGDQVRVGEKLVPRFDVPRVLRNAEHDLWSARRPARNIS